MTSFKEKMTNLQETLMSRDDYNYLLGRFIFLSNRPNTERIQFVSTIHGVDTIMAAHVNYSKKSQKDAVEAMSAAKTALKRGDVETALDMYTRCIMFAESKSAELSAAFANRSEVLFKNGYFSNCINDIQKAIVNEYPLNVRYKLWERKAKCLEYNGDIKGAIDAYREGKVTISNSLMTQQNISQWKTKVNAEIKKLRNTLSTSGQNLGGAKQKGRECEIYKDCSSKEYDVADWKCVKEMAAPDTINFNASFPCATDAFSIKFDVEHGRYAVATRKINPGEVIIAERPSIRLLMSDLNTKYCHYCCARVYSGVPCKQCSGVLFCSDICRKAAWSAYHYIECKFTKFLENLNEPHAIMALRTVLTWGWESIVAFDLKMAEELREDDAYSGRCHDNVYRSRSYHALYGLVNHESLTSNAVLFELTNLALILINLLKQSSYFGHTRTESAMNKESANCINVSEVDVPLVVGSHMLRHMMMLKQNALDVCPVDSGGTANVGYVLCETVSLLNHSCSGNTCSKFDNGCMVIKASRLIEKGEEINRTYDNLSYETVEKELRQQVLKDLHHFDCGCIACRDDWPTIHK